MTTPIVDQSKAFRGVVGLTVEVGRFVELQAGDAQFAVLVDWRDGENKGVILQHPLLDDLRRRNGSIPARFKDYRLTAAELPGSQAGSRQLPRSAGQRSRGRPPTEALAGADGTGPPAQSRDRLDRDRPGVVRPRDRHVAGGRRAAPDRYGLTAVGAVVLVILGLWALAVRLLNQPSPARYAPADAPGTATAGSVTPDSPAETYAKP